MEWEQLHRFLTVAQEENVTKAAELLRTSQPSLSQSIRRLESDLGFPLFTRDGKHIQLNESGKILMHTAQQIEALMEYTELHLEELNKQNHPVVTLHIATVSALLPQLLLFLRQQNPAIQYQIYQWKNEQITKEEGIQILSSPVSQISSDNPDYQSNQLKLSKKSSSFMEEILLTEDICLALPKKHYLAEKKELSIKDLCHEEFICLNDQWPLGKLIMDEMEHINFFPKITMCVDNPNMMRELLKANLGIAFVPSVSWRMFAGDHIVFRTLNDFKASRMVYLKTSSRQYQTKEQKECIALIKKFFSQQLWKDSSPIK